MLAETNYTVINRETLPFDGNTYAFEGGRFPATDISFIWVDMPPNGSVRLHKHPYQEIFIIQEGEATFTVGTATLVGNAGQIIIVPAETAHKFMNTGDQQLKQIDIHVSPQFITHWLED